MFDLFDSLSPRVYVVSDSEYKKYRERQNDAKIERLEEERRYYQKRLDKLDAEIESLRSVD
jgi:peptidoglycan hydrolase CwlO-like protein